MKLAMRDRWEDLKLAVSEFFWRFHPRRNRWCDHCGEFVGNSAEDAAVHRCGWGRR